MRSPVELTKESAIHVAKWRIQEILDEDKLKPESQRMPMMKSFALSQAVKKHGPVDEIAEILYSLGIKLSIDQNNKEHAAWIKHNRVILEQP